MNILELDSYKLSDAVKFNQHLNPKLWGSDEHLKPEVREQLLKIAEDFREFLGLDDLQLKDITISGSNAAYNYTDHSDIDLHLVVDIPQADDNDVYRELFDAKKYQYNDMHDFRIGRYDIELYVENANKQPVSQGIYSVLNNDWIAVPRRQRANIDDTSVRNKYEDIGQRIDQAVKSGDLEQLTKLAEKIKEFRQAGLAETGEYGPENLAFKMLRAQGKIKELYDARNKAKDRELSLKERKKPGSVFKYGFKHESEMAEDAGETWDGVNPTTCMIVDEAQALSDEDILRDFVDFCAKELKLEHMPQIKLRRDPQWSSVHRTFGRYIDDKKTLEVAWGQRHIMDVLRTVAHELTHKHQHERDGERMGPDAGETGSKWENEANARAGILMRDYGRLHPEYFEKGQAEELHGDEVNESASGYIPTKKQAKDPRYIMALTKDIRPGAVGREANKLKLKTDSQGHPQQLRANGLFEELRLQLERFKKKGTVVESEEQLDEVRMAPSNLKQFADSEEAQGIRAGFEAELIFRDTQSDGDSDYDQEPDMDMDERCSSLSQIVEFFDNDDYGYGLSPRERRNLEEQLDEKYYEWYDEQLYDEWRDEQDEQVREVLLDEQSWEDRVHAVLVDGMEFSDEEADRIFALGEARKKGQGKPGSEYTEEELDMLSTYNEAATDADAILDEEVESSISSEDKFYDAALDNFRDNFSISDDSGFFTDVGLRWMSDVADEFNLSWPYYTSSSNGGSRDWDEIGDSLSEVVGMPVKVSSGYHSTARREGVWIVEPDSSLEPDDREDFGLEIVSPPMPLKQALEKLEAVTDWANSEGNAYTNESTGLHMGVSIPYKEGRVDYLKLIMFLGDEYVLEQFGRESNTYTKAAMREIRSRAGSERNATAVLELLRNNLVELAERELARSTGEGKYTSAHKHGKYIEFRSAGGDWLAEDNAEPGKLENTMMRYAYAMYLAGRPDLERKEYAKKLYKLVSNGTDDSTMALFSQFAAGTIDKEQLKKQWAEKTLSREEPSAVGKDNWVVVDKSTRQPMPNGTYNGYTRAEALERAEEKFGEMGWRFDLEPQNTGRWEVYRDDHGQEETLEIIDAKGKAEAVDKAYEKYTGVIPFKVRAYHGDAKIGPEKELSPRAKLAKRIVQQKKQPADSGPDASSDWEAVYTPTGRVIDTLAHADADQAQTWRQMVIRQHDFTNQAELIVVRRAGSQQAQQQQAKDANDVPMWELYDKMTGHAIHSFANLDQNAAWTQGQQWLRSMGAEDPDTYQERFAIRPKA